MREIVHIQAGQCGNQIGSKVVTWLFFHQQLKNRDTTCLASLSLKVY